MGRIPDHLLRLAQRVAEGRWVTIGAKADPKRPGKKKGGTPVELDGEGVIQKGPAALTGKRPSELSQSHLFTGQPHKSQRKLFAEPGDPVPPPRLDPEAKPQAQAPAKKEPKPKAKKPQNMSLLAVIRREGGISGGDFEHADFREHGLLGALNKNGFGIDDMAAMLVRGGHIIVPHGVSSPGDYLLQLLKKKTNSLLADKTSELEKDFEAYARAREEALADGHQERELEEVRGRGQEAGADAGTGDILEEIFGPDLGRGGEAGAEEPGDLAGDAAEPASGVDTSFDFGPAAAPKVEDKPKAEPKKAAADKPKGATLQPDGTLKTKDGTVWVRAKAGGEHSPVTDKHYKGGQWMPIHGMSRPKAEKPAEEPVGTQSVEPGEGDKERADDMAGPRPPRERMSPEEKAERQQAKDHWDAMNQGPMKDLVWLGDYPNQKALSNHIVGTNKWQQFAQKVGEEKLKAIAQHFKDKLKEIDPSFFEDGMDKVHQSRIDYNKTFFKRAHRKENPSSAEAHYWFQTALGETPKTAAGWRSVSDQLAGLVADEPAPPPAVEPEPAAPPAPGTNLFGQPEPTKPQPATTQGLFGEQVPVEDKKAQPQPTAADDAAKGLDWLDQKQDKKTDGTGEMFGGLFSPGQQASQVQQEPVAPPPVEPEANAKPKVTPPAPKAPYAQRRGSVNFSPVTGPTGHKLVGYNWEHDKVDTVDDRGENRTRKVSAWDRATQADETNRPIVHNFTVQAPDGTTKTVSLETAARLLGFDASGEEPKAKFQSAVSAAKTLAKLQMERAELVQRADRWKKDKADVDRQVEALPDDQIEEVPDTMGRPEYRVFRWKNQPEISIRRKMNQPDADREEAKRQVRWALADSEMEKRGHKEMNFRPNTAKIDGSIKRAQEKLDELTKQASQPVTAARASTLTDLALQKAGVAQNTDDAGLKQAGPVTPPKVEPAPAQKLKATDDEARKHVDAALKAGDADEYWDENKDDPKFTKAFNQSKQQFLQSVSQAESSKAEADKPAPAPAVEPAAPPEPAAAPAKQDLARPAPAAQPNADKIAKIESEPTTPAAAASVPKPNETPRQTAQRVDKAMDADYIYARASEVGNFGRDVANSARHRVNEWRGLAEAEANGSAAKLVSRDNLLKVEPHSLAATSRPKTALSHLMAHLALSAMPPKPFGDKEYDDYRKFAEKVNSGDRPIHDGESLKIVGKLGIEKVGVKDAEQLRQDYYRVFRELKATAEDLAKNNADPSDVNSGMYKKVRSLLQDLAKTPLQGKNKSVQETMNRYSPVYNALSKYRDSLVGRAGPYKKLQEFANMFGQKYGPDKIRAILSGSDEASQVMDQVNSHVLDVMDGQSFSQTFGAEKTTDGKKRFDPTEAYVTGQATRSGGRKVQADTTDAGKRFMLDRLKLSGVQWGNSVSDDERKHHLQKSSEALADLADVIGADDSIISLGGKLALSIGARGSGKALAHYEPSEKVMNLTRKNGVGSLAHEWGHALDHYLTGHADATRSDRAFQSNNQHMRMEPTANTPVEKAVHGVMRALNRSGFRNRLMTEIYNMRKNGVTLNLDYWMSGHETFARSFERHVQKKMKDAGQDNTYLVSLRKEGHPLWPNDKEMAEIGPAFESLFEVLRQKHPRKANATESRQARINNIIRGIFREAI